MRIPPLTGALVISMLMLLPVSFWLFPYVIGCNSCILRGEWWRLITSIFFHGDFAHFVSNAVGLLLLGFCIEPLLSRRSFLLLFFGSGLAGNIITLLILPPQYIHTGASGAIFGLLGAQIYLLYLQRKQQERHETPLLAIALLLLVGSTFLDSSVNAAAHLGGLLGGGVLMPLLYRK